MVNNLFQKCKAERLLTDIETSPCWFCQNPTQYILIEKDKSEIWCCEYCLWKHGKIKRFKSRMMKYATQPKKVKNFSKSTHKNREKQGLLEGFK